MTDSVKRAAVIGAGAMGLAAAYDLAKAGCKVDVFERDDRIGGMSASFDFDGLNLERYYHFVCAPDHTLFDMLKELGLYGKLKWVETKMGFFYEGVLYKWGNPFYLLSFPKADIFTKLRYGLHLFLASKRRDWEALDGVPAKAWIRRFVGSRGYDIFWRTLFDLKFYDYGDSISAAWIWTRLKRVAVSRKNLFTERLGYIEGGSETLLTELQRRIVAMGGTVRLGSRVEQVLMENGKASGLQIDGEAVKYDAVISTVPLPYVPQLIPGLPERHIQQIRSVDNIGVVCVVLKLKHALSDYFWMNINDSTFDIPGIIEYSNLYPLKDHVVYIPFYLHESHPKHRLPDKAFLEEVMTYMKKINPNYEEDWLLSGHVSRYRYAQPVCPPGFLEKLPPMKSDVPNLYMADTSYYYPEDRSISESMRVGLELAGLARRG